jgi:ribokinase
LADRFGIGCVKLGRDGAIAVRGHETQQRRAAPVFRETPFGAGDAFAGTLLVALAANESLGDALERACNAGARAAKSCAAK